MPEVVALTKSSWTKLKTRHKCIHKYSLASPTSTCTQSPGPAMSRSAVPPVSVTPTDPDSLSLLHQRLLLAEEEAESLIQDMGALGVSRDQIMGSAERPGATQRLGSPLKMRRVLGDEGVLWQQCDSLVSRVCRMESELQTLKLTLFRLETERELDPSHAANLKQQLAALQQESEEELQTSRREAMKLRDQLQQAYEERDEARAQLQCLGDTLEAASAAKVDVALAAEELKIVKLEMSQKLTEMKEQMRLESVRAAEAVKSRGELLQRVEETERVMEAERRQALVLQADCQALHVEVQTGRRRLEEERDGGRQLEERCQRLREQTAMKDSLLSELKTELKALQTENSKLLQDRRELRAAADRVQTLNEQLQSQCSQLSSAMRSLTVENEKLQASLKAERSRVVEQLQEKELLLEAAGRNVRTELQAALTHKAGLQRELETLRGEHAQLLQSSSIAQETALTQRELLERTIERLRGELSTAKKEEGAMRKDLEGLKNELCLAVTKLEDEKRSLETELREAKREAGCLSSALQSQQDENRRIMGKMAALQQQQLDQMLKDLTDKNKPVYEKGDIKISELEVFCSPAHEFVSQTLEDIVASRTRVQLGGRILQEKEARGQDQDLVSLQEDRLQAQREIRSHQAEVEKLQRLLTSTHHKSNRAVESLQKALFTAKVDNKRLAHSLQQAAATSSTLHDKLEQARDRHQAAVALRDEEIRRARAKICDLSEELSAVEHRTRGDYESSLKTLHQKISELKSTVQGSSTGSADLSEELRGRVSHLEGQVSKHKACIREQRRQLRQLQRSRDLQDGAQSEERLEEEEGRRDQLEKDDNKIQVDSQQVSRHKQEAAWQRWTSTIQRWEAKRELAHVAGGARAARTQLITQSH